MVSIVLFLLILSGGSLFGAVVLNRRFTDCLPLSVGGMMAILYVCGLLSILRAGVWLIIAAAAVLIAASIVHVIRRRDPIAALKRVFTADTVIFFVVILILTICTIGMEATAWDEFSHWMDSVKCMTIIDDLGTSPAADIVFPSYPPGISLIQYLLQKIHLLTGGTAFSEWRSMIAGKIVIVSMMAPLFGRLRRRRITGMFLEIVVLLLLPGMLYDWYFISSLIDPYLGILSGTGLMYLIVLDDQPKLKAACTASAGFILVLAKDAGLLFAIFLCIGVLVSEYLTRNHRTHPQRLFTILLNIAVTLLAKVSWSAHLAARGIAAPFHEPIVFSDLIRIILGKDNTWRQASWNGFFPRLFREPVTLGPLQLCVSFFGLFLICMVVLVILLILLRRYGRERFSICRNTAILGVLQLVIYIAGMAVEYLFQFSEYEGSHYASFERYLKLPYLGLFLIMAALVMELYDSFPARSAAALIPALYAALLLLLSPLGFVQGFLSRSFVALSHEERRVYDELSERLHSITDDGSAYFISQQDDGTVFYKFRFLARPVHLQENHWTLGDAPRYENDFYEYDIGPDEWMDLLCASYDYVVICKPDAYFTETYGCLFEDPQEITQNSIFEVDREHRQLFKAPA